MALIDGKAQAAAICEALKPQIQDLIEKGVTPALRVILVGDDPASKVYVNSKEKKAASLGIDGQVIRMDANTSESDLLLKIHALNADPAVHGILVQLPLPAHLDENTIISHIAPEKDVDGIHDVNMGRLLSGRLGLVACTPSGSIELIRSTGRSMEGLHAVVLGRSNIVGKPISILLQRENATVTMCHSRTRNLQELCKSADILIAAIGKAHFVKADMVKPGAIVIDVGINRIDGKLCGDVDFEAVKDIASFITPVPGGVGPMTIAMLMKNTVLAAKGASA